MARRVGPDIRRRRAHTEIALDPESGADDVTGRWCGSDGSRLASMMSVSPVDRFADTVMGDFHRRRAADRGVVVASAAPALETRALGHPEFEELQVGQRRAASIAAVFLDLTDFTGRSFWDDEVEVADLAHAVLTGFVEIVTSFGGHPLGLRGDGLFAGFGPGDPRIDGSMALGACAFALKAVEEGLNPRLEDAGIRPVKARAGVDHGRLTFVRSGSPEHSEVNVIGFAANFAAKCEKQAGSWEVVAGQGLQQLLPSAPSLTEHALSPKRYQRDYQVRTYKFYDYHWRQTVPHLPGTVEQIGGHPTARIAIG